MFETVLIATDGSASAERAVDVALDLADRFDARVHALYVVDAGEVASSPGEVREELERALGTAGGRALSFVRESAGEPDEGDDAGVGGDGAGVGGDERGEQTGEGGVVTAVREGTPVTEICRYAEEHAVDVVVTGTRGRTGPKFVLGSVAEGVVRRSDVPVLTVRQPEGT